MPRFVAVHTASFTEQQLKELAATPLPAGVSWSQSYCAFGEGKFFCDWRAPSKEAILQVFKDHKVPYDTIYEVRRFDVAMGAMDPH